MKILHMISSGGMYGAESVILNLSRSLRELGHQCSLGIFENSHLNNSELADRALSQGLDVETIECKGRLDRAVPARILEIIGRVRPTVVHSHGYKADIYCYLARRRSPATPLVATCHNWIDISLALRAYGAFDRFCLRHFDRVAAVSNDVASRLISSGVPSERVQLISNGVDLRPYETTRFDRDTIRPVTVGLVGRLSREKGVDVFVDAAALVCRHVPDVSFVVAGDGPERGALENQIRDLGLSARITLAGNQNDMPSFYKRLDILALSSRTEGLPMTLLEGMASSLPTIATNVGEIPNVIQHENTGLLVPPDDATALAQSIIRLLADPQFRCTLAERGNEAVRDHFSAQRMAADYLNLYEMTLGSCRSESHKKTDD